ncbi:MAG: M1 family metallopeptidase [Minicystis sp.]
MPRRLLPALLVALLAAACAAEPIPPSTPAPPSPTTAEPAPAPSPPALRLPKTAAPVRYSATLTIVPTGNAIEGVVDIDLTIAEATSILWLNATEITVSEARLTVGDRSIAARVVPGGEDFVGFAFGEAVPAGAARLHVAYRGQVSDKDDRGVFKEVEDGAPYVYSQFENTEARRAFPCFDEPSFKVPWQLTLRVPEGEVALSNTPAVSETKEGGMKVVRFAETKPLPSYLVAFAVGPFDLVDAGKAGKNGTQIRIGVPRGRGPRAGYAVKTSGTLLARLEDYFGSPYPYEKLDLVAVPHLISFGAMENAGLITCAERILIARPEEETTAFQQRFAAVTGHEMAHQWFGDLVTMAWWDDVWLNEAFATWMEDKLVGPWKPEWQWELIRSKGTSGAMYGDALVSARRIRQAIASNDDIQNAFDEITYNKGAAVIGMFEAFAGPEKFRRGVQRYMSEHRYQNATSADFLAAVSAETSADLGPAFTTFLDQPGVPVVRGELSCTPGKKGEAKIKLSQRRHLPAGSPGSPDQSWQIPVCFRWGAGKSEGRACTMLKEREATVPIAGASSCPDWVMLNAGDAGYYHGGYGAAGLAALFKHGWARLTPAERSSVMRDMAALLASGELPAADVLARVPDLAKDPAPEVLEGALGIVGALRDSMVPPALRPGFARFVQKTFGERARKLGWLPQAGESDRLRLLRPGLMLGVAGRGEDPALVAEAQKLALRWLDDDKAVPHDMVGAVLGVAAAHGDQKLFDRFRAEMKKTKDESRRHALVRALAGFRDPALARAALGLFLGDELDPRLGVELLWQDDRVADAIFEAVKQSYDAVFTRMPGQLRGDLPYIAEPFCDEARLADVKAFFEPRAPKLTGGPRNLAKVLERIALCSAQRRAHEASLTAFLKKY